MFLVWRSSQKPTFNERQGVLRSYSLRYFPTGSPSVVSTQDNLPADVTNFNLTGLRKGTTYMLIVLSHNRASASSPTASVETMTTTTGVFVWKTMAVWAKYCKSRIFCKACYFRLFRNEKLPYENKMHTKGTKLVRESAAVSDCMEISCVWKRSESPEYENLVRKKYSGFTIVKEGENCFFLLF